MGWVCYQQASPNSLTGKAKAKCNLDYQPFLCLFHYLVGQKLGFRIFFIKSTFHKLSSKYSSSSGGSLVMTLDISI